MSDTNLHWNIVSSFEGTHFPVDELIWKIRLRLDFLLMKTTNTVVVWDRDMRLVMYNATWADLATSIHGAPLPLNFNPLSYLPDDVQEQWAAIHKQVNKGETVSFGLSMPFHSGLLQRYEIKAYPLIIDGHVEGIAEIGQEINPPGLRPEMDTAQAEQPVLVVFERGSDAGQKPVGNEYPLKFNLTRYTREQFETFFYGIIMNSAEPIVIRDREGIPAYYNHAYSRLVKQILGVDMQPGMVVQGLFPEAVRNLAEDSKKRLMEGETISLIQQFDCHDGSRLTLAVIAVPLTIDGTLQGVLQINRQIPVSGEVSDDPKPLHELEEMGVNGALTDIPMIQDLVLQIDRDRREIEKKDVEINDIKRAVREMLKHRERDQRQMEERLSINLRENVLPLLAQCRELGVSQRQQELLDIIVRSVNDACSPFTQNMIFAEHGFSPAEIRVAALIRDGKSSKDIARIVGISIRTVDSHRRSIRKKLGLRRSGENLRDYLLTI